MVARTRFYEVIGVIENEPARDLIVLPGESLPWPPRINPRAAKIVTGFWRCQNCVTALEGRGTHKFCRRGRPFALWVIFASLVYISLAVLVFLIPIVIALGSAAPLGLILLVLVVFPAIFFVAAFFSLLGKRWAFVLAAASTTVFFLLNLSEIADSGSNPASAGFALSMSIVPAYFLVLFFSILSLINAKKGIDQKRYLATRESSGGLFTLAAIGFVIGAVVSGAIGAGVINGLIENLGQGVDIEIVEGAVGAAVPFSPASLTVSVGDTVTWLNTDSTTHTVTSDTGAFDSDLLTTGGIWSYTFTQAGTYAYHCTPHPQMTGTIIVQ